MTEIPEHLLKRSRAAKGKPEDGGGDAPAAASKEVAPAAEAGSGQPAALAKAAASIAPDKAPAPEPPAPAYSTAAKARKKMPLWAVGLVAALPVWAWIYAGTMQEQIVEDTFFVEAEEIYAVEGGCAGCHGSGGGGGVGYQLSDGQILQTFPAAIDQMVHVARGSAAINGETYGDPAREGGARVSGQRGAMPAFGGANGLSLEHLELVIFHERIVLGGEDASSEANIVWEEELREKIESGASTPIDDEALALLLACADPEMTPGATGDIEDRELCPGPPELGGDEAAMEG